MAYLVSFLEDMQPFGQIYADDMKEAQYRVLEYLWNAKSRFPEFMNCIIDTMDVDELLELFNEDYEFSLSDYDTLNKLFNAGQIYSIMEIQFESMDQESAEHIQIALKDEWIQAADRQFSDFFEILSMADLVTV